MMSRFSNAVMIIVARTIYSMYWFYLAPALPMISTEFGVSKALLGLVPFMFIVGAASFQVPAGIIASRIGNAMTAGLGLLIMAVTGSLVSLSSNFYELLVLRFIAGIGAAMFFSTGAAILSLTYPEKAGTLLGIYNAAFGLGSGLGLTLGLVYVLIGWRPAVLAFSLLGVPISIAVLSIRGGRASRTGIKFSREAVITGIATSGFWGAYYAASSLLPTYAVLRGLPLRISSILTSIMLFSSVLGGLSGRVVDVVENRVVLIVVLTVVGTLPLIFVPTLNIAAIIIAGLLMGYTNELALTAAYTLVAGHENPALSLATLNALNMAIGMWLSVVFSETLIFSESLPWILMIIASIAPLSLFLLVRRR